MISRFWFALVLFCLTLTTNAQGNQAAVEKILQREMEDRKIPGMQVAVVRGNSIVFSRSYGFANMEDRLPVTKTSLFPINSCTKAITAVAVMQLVEKGKLRLADPVSVYLDSLPAEWQQVTINQMLTHSSGFPDILRLTLANMGGMGPMKNEAAVWEKLRSMPLDFPAGREFRYNQTNFYLLGKIIGKLSGEYFSDLIPRTEFIPAGMKYTRYGDSRDVLPGYAPTYRYNTWMDGRKLDSVKLVRDYFEFPFYTRTSSGLVSTAEDLARWVMALQQGKLLRSQETIDTMWSPSAYTDGTPTSWARGWGLAKFRKKHRAFGMSGGSRAAFLLYPEDDLAVIVLTNLGGAYPEDFLEEIAGCYIPGIIDADPVTYLWTRLQKNGYSDAIGIARAKMKTDPDFKPAENELNDWAYRMMARDELKNAAEIFRLNIDLFPGSWNAYDSYAEVLLKSGDKTNAIRMYRKSVELNPQNDNGIRQLQKLE